MHRIAAISLVSSLIAMDASGQPPPYREAIPVREHRPAIEWSTWVRLGYLMTDAPVADVAGPRAMLPAPVDEAPSWESALGADASIALGSGGDLRLGAWGELRSASRPVLGAEVMFGAAPAKLDLFQHQGEGVLVLRGGGNDEVLTAAIAYGYRCAWKLFGPWNGGTRYMIGVRLVVSATRARHDDGEWAAMAGIEFEPIGSFRYLFGVRSWY